MKTVDSTWKWQDQTKKPSLSIWCGASLKDVHADGSRYFQPERVSLADFVDAASCLNHKCTYQESRLHARSGPDNAHAVTWQCQRLWAM